MNSIMHIHFIAIGGAVMHSLAIALKKKGYTITGSDDEIFEPAYNNLNKHKLLPDKTGWHADRVNSSIDAVILGMHAKKDNPELLKAQELGLKIYSFPEYIYELSKDKQRVVIAGSHGKTTITSMIIHVLNYYNKQFDHLLGAKITGIENMISISSDAPLILLEGDEYLSSSIDKRPKFLHYDPDICLISGIAWDHINVFPTEKDYITQFEELVNKLKKDAVLIYNKDDKQLCKLVEGHKSLNGIGYSTLPHFIDSGKVYLKYENIPLKIFGQHNIENLSAAKEVCKQLGVEEDPFYAAIQHFKGASKRLEVIGSNEHAIMLNDFAHAPSKVKASISATKKLYPNRKLIACFELHTFSSLNKKFISQYKDAMKEADLPIIYINPQKLSDKNLDLISEDEIKQAFNDPFLKVFNDINVLKEHLLSFTWKEKNLLMMSSGNFDDLDIKELTNFVIK